MYEASVASHTCTGEYKSAKSERQEVRKEKHNTGKFFSLIDYMSIDLLTCRSKPACRQRQVQNLEVSDTTGDATNTTAGHI